MRFDWLVISLYIALPVSFAVKSKVAGHEYTNDVIHGQCAPLGPLSDTFIAKRRLPGFPFEFPNIIPGHHDNYLIFPAPDALSGHEASVRRCEAYNGHLVDLVSAAEMEILACAIGTPSFVGAWLDTSPDPHLCTVLYPGGVVSISHENCLGTFGSICKVSGSRFLDKFYIDLDG